MCLCCLRVCVWARAPPLSSNKGGSCGGRGPCGRARPCPAPPPCCVSRVRPVGGAVATRVYPKLSRIPCVFTWVCVCVRARALGRGGQAHSSGTAWPGPGPVPRCPRCLPAGACLRTATGGGAGAVPEPWSACPGIPWEGENGGPLEILHGVGQGTGTFARCQVSFGQVGEPCVGATVAAGG